MLNPVEKWWVLLLLIALINSLLSIPYNPILTILGHKILEEQQGVQVSVSIQETEISMSGVRIWLTNVRRGQQGPETG